MKTHFGDMENYGDYESPMWGCEETLCGETGEMPCENATGDWNLVDCKKCLKLKDNHKKEIEIIESHIVNDMGAMADFIQKRYEFEKANNIIWDDKIGGHTKNNNTINDKKYDKLFKEWEQEK